MKAAWRGHGEPITALLKAGAECDLKHQDNSLGLSAKALAEREGHAEKLAPFFRAGEQAQATQKRKAMLVRRPGCHGENGRCSGPR